MPYTRDEVFDIGALKIARDIAKTHEDTPSPEELYELADVRLLAHLTDSDPNSVALRVINLIERWS
jgi:hypothetical protein